MTKDELKALSNELYVQEQAATTKHRNLNDQLIDALVTKTDGNILVGGIVFNDPDIEEGSSGVIIRENGGIVLSRNTDPYINFHCNKTPAYTMRLINYNTNYLRVFANNGNTPYLECPVFVGTVVSSSDNSVKENIQDLGPTLDKVKNLKGIKFDYKEEYSDGRTHLGISAQEIRKYFPEVVSEDNGVLNVAYSELIPVLLNSINELSQKNEELSEKVDRLLQQVESLLSKI